MTRLGISVCVALGAVATAEAVVIILCGLKYLGAV